ncbi:hypothetical protein F4804DRAFT_318371 [Jackrogersella minutella]|nr:hypothetical protein F4804DRAFT_318371 [Jackrogersella minutella]
MQLSLATAIALFLITTPLTYTLTIDNSNLAPQLSRDSQVEVRDDIDFSSVDVEDVDITERDFLHSDATIHCANEGKIKRVKPGYKGRCNPANSRGFRSAHNCKTEEKGKSYLCVQGKKATCYTISDAERNNFENGECFIRK